MDIIRYLRADDREFRTCMQQLCQWSLMGKHLVPLLIQYWKRDNLIDWNLSLLIGTHITVQKKKDIVKTLRHKTKQYNTQK
jgi:hypothetical protein